MATAYYRDDPGAPALVYSTGQARPAWVALLTILKTCLVTGYGSKPGAGWELIAEGADHLVLRNGTHSGYLGLKFIQASALFEVTVSATFAGVVSDTLTGSGAKSGTATASTVPQRIKNQYAAYSSAASSWSIVADDKSFALSLVGYPSLTALNGGVNGCCCCLYAGEDSKGNFIVVGGQNTTSGTPSDLFFSGGFTALKDPVTGLLVDTVILSVAMSIGNPTRDASALALVDQVSLGPVLWGKVGAVADAKLRGVVLPSVGNPHYPSQAANALGVPGTLNTRTYTAAIDLMDEYQYFLFGGSFNNGSTLLITSNPEFW